MIAAYEKILEIPEHLFRTISDHLHHLDTGTPRAAIGPPEPHQEIDALFASTESGSATGGEWIRLAQALTGYDRIYLSQAAWSGLAGRLVNELSRAVGVGLLRRHCAATALLRHESAQRPMLLAIGEHITTAEAQVIEPVVAPLATLASPQVSALILRFTRSDSPLLRAAGESLLATKLRLGHFDPEATAALESYAIQSLQEMAPTSTALHPAEVAIALPLRSFARVSGALRNTTARQRLESVAATGEVLSSEVTRPISRDLASAATAALWSAVVDEDRMLERLIREALFHARRSRRQSAGHFLAASPYADVLSSEVLSLAEHPSPVVADRAWSLLRRIGAGPQHERISDLALADDTIGDRTQALLQLGMSVPSLSAQQSDRVAALATQAESPEIRHSALFALGMAGSEKIADIAGAGGTLGRSASWWAANGPALRDRDDPATTQAVVPHPRRP